MKNKDQKRQLVFKTGKQLLASTLIVLGLMVIPSESKGQTLTWEQMHAPADESITSIIKLKDGELFTGTVKNGVYEFVGDQWVSRNKGLGSLNIQALGGTSINKLFAGTTEGLYRYQQSEKNWVSSGLSENISAIAFNANADIYAGAIEKIFRSTDDGATWDTLTINGISGDFRIEKIHITSNGIIYISIPELPHFYKSTDNGKTWNLLWDNMSLSDLASNSENHIYAGIDGEGVKVSTDDGIEWEHVSIDFMGLRNPVLYIDLNDNLWVGDYHGNVYYLEAGTNDAININGDLNSGEIIDLTFNGSNKVCIGTADNGVFLGADIGKHWEQLNAGFKYANVDYLFSDGASNVYAGAVQLNLFKYSSDNQDWRSLYAGGSSNYQFVVNKNQQIFVSLVQGFFASAGLIRSDDNGETWTDIGQTLPGYPIGIPIINGIVSNSDGKLFLMLSTGGIYESEDNGDTWEEATNNIGVENAIFCLNINSEDYIFGGSRTGQIFRSMDGGQSWDTLSTPIKTDIAKIKSNSKGQVFALSSYGDKMVYSPDHGENWLPVEIKELDSSVSSFIFDKNDVMYVSTRGNGIFKTSDYGESWTATNQDLLGLNVLDLTYSSDDRIYCSTRDNGVFRTDEPLYTGVEKVNSEDFPLYYPNPARSHVIIEFKQFRSHASLSILNVQGAVVRQVDGLSGDSLTLYRDGLPGGLYFLRLTEGGVTQNVGKIMFND